MYFKLTNTSFHYMFQVEEFIKIMDPIKFAKTSLLLQIAELYTLIANMEGNLIYFVLIKWLSTCFKMSLGKL